MTNFPERHTQLRRGFRALATSQSDVMAGFRTMHHAAMVDGALPTSVKELMALAIGITSHCEGCIAFHVHDALRAGATRAQVEETIGVAVMMGGGPAAVFGSDALEALAQFEEAAAS